MPALTGYFFGQNYMAFTISSVLRGFLKKNYISGLFLGQSQCIGLLTSQNGSHEHFFQCCKPEIVFSN